MEPTNPEARVPLRIGRYTDLHILGRGGMGAVYRAYDPELDRPVAIKVMLHSTPDFIARFRREAQSIARLTHGNVVQVFDFGVDEDSNPYFVMELVEGTPLDALLLQRRLSYEEAIEFARQAALGLSAAHRAGIIHRDVKPSNLIIDARGGVKLVDFGIARASAGAQLTTAASLMGTPGYMAPEQAQGKTVDHRADIYALGLTLFEMLAGAPPFQAEDPIALVVMNMQEPLPDLRTRGLGLPEDLILLVEQMAKKSPDERVQSCDAVARALEGIGAGVAGTAAAPRAGIAVAEASSPSVPPTNIRSLPADASGRRGAAIAGGAAIAVAGVGIALALYYSPWKTTPTVEPPRPETQVEQASAREAAEKAGKKAEVAAGKDETQADKGAAKAGATTIEQAQRPAALDKSGQLSVAVLKFNNISKDAALEGLSLGIGETVASAFGDQKDARLRLVERSDLESDIVEIDRGKDEHFDKASVAQLGKLVGVHVAVQGAFQRVGTTLRITARFVRVETAEILDSVKVEGRVKDQFDLQDKMAKELRGHLLALLDKERPPSGQARGTQ
jgi:TolB-like protein